MTLALVIIAIFFTVNQFVIFLLDFAALHCREFASATAGYIQSVPTKVAPRTSSITALN